MAEEPHKMDDQQLGELIGTVRAIKENTDKLPDALTLLAVHDVQLKTLIPLVRTHEKITQRALMLAVVVSTAVTVLSEMYHR